MDMQKEVQRKMQEEVQEEEIKDMALYIVNVYCVQSVLLFMTFHLSHIC